MVARIALVLTSENGAMHVPHRADVYNPVPELDKVLRALLAAAGFNLVSMSRNMHNGVTTSYASEPMMGPSRGGARLALPVNINGTVLASLIPNAYIDIGSLAKFLPGTQWEVDGGAQVAFVPFHKFHAGPIRLPSNAPHMLRSLGPSHVQLAVIRVPNIYSEGLTRMSHSLQNVDGVPLREGDTLQDADKTMWFYRQGAVVDCLHASVSAQDVAVDDDNNLRPRRSDALPAGYRHSTAYVVDIRWPERDGGGHTSFKAESLPAPDQGWKLKVPIATVEHPMGLCQGPLGVRMDSPNAKECVLAGGTWDRPCESDTECPFYDHRRGRGGCQHGFCEMPMGIDRQSFRKHGDESNIMYHGCGSDSSDYPHCRGMDNVAEDARFEV